MVRRPWIAAAGWLILCAATLRPALCRADEAASDWYQRMMSDGEVEDDPFAREGAESLVNADRPAALPAAYDEPPPEAFYEPHSLGADTQRRMANPFAHRRDPSEYWSCEFLPPGLLYKSYLAGPKEPRMAAIWIHDPDLGWFWDVTLGARVGLWRYGTHGPHPEGWQLDLEGAVFPRLNFEEQWDLESADFRFGLPLTWSYGPMQMKFGYYHVSAHVGDEFLERNPGFQRINYVRDGLLLGYGIFPTPDLRLYSEIGWAFHHSGGAEPVELQFGAEFSPVLCRPSGTPFAAANAQLFEEHSFGGSLNLQAGWQWRSHSDRLLRLGLQYFSGKTSQYAFFDRSEELLGLGIWLDF